MNEFKINRNALKQIVSESIKNILKEEYDYNYGSQNIAIIREIYQLVLKIEKIAEGFGETPINLYTEDIRNLCITLKKNLINEQK